MSGTPHNRRYASWLGVGNNTADHLVEAAESIQSQLGGSPDWVCLFASFHFRTILPRLLSQLHEHVPSGVWTGCTGESIVGPGCEVEDQPALALWAARLPGTQLCGMHLTLERTADGLAFGGFPDQVPEQCLMMLLAEPFSFPADVLLQRWDEDRPAMRVTGGMASGGTAPGENLLMLNQQVLDHGAVAVALWGELVADTVVSQGCRPIGEPMVVTRAEQNIIYELGGRPALAQLQAIFDQLPNREKQLVQNGLHLGRVVSEYGGEFARGDFLVRNVLGIDPNTRAVVAGDFFRPGQTVQFHLRDAQTAHRDLENLLARAQPSRVDQPSGCGALLFTCNGRGSRLFPTPHHDALAVQRRWGDVPLAGFFAQGEIGPIGGSNFLHGFTASLLVLS